MPQYHRACRRHDIESQMDQRIGRRLRSHLHFRIFLATDSYRQIAESAGATQNCVDQGAGDPDATCTPLVSIGIAENNLLVGTATATEAAVLAGRSNGGLGWTSLTVLTRKASELPIDVNTRHL